ncbi:MAG: DUF1848 domain-containing protein [Desulfomonilaceae bacterium]
MRIISASRRTDIPAFHSDWMISQFREKTVSLVNPFNKKLSVVSLAPQDVIAIVFWTKNAQPMTRYLDELLDLGHQFTFLYTINNYPECVEPNVPDLCHNMKVVEQLYRNYGSTVLRWRYDTIVLSKTTGRSWHMKNFRDLSRILCPFVNECVFSFCDYYNKTKKKVASRLPDYWEPDQQESAEIAMELADVASEYGIRMYSCAHDFLAVGSIRPASCIDVNFLKNLVTSDEKKQSLEKIEIKPTRKNCKCSASTDIGTYGTCKHGCIYCYAAR